MRHFSLLASAITILSTSLLVSPVGANAVPDDTTSAVSDDATVEQPAATETAVAQPSATDAAVDQAAATQTVVDQPSATDAVALIADPEMQAILATSTAPGAPTVGKWTESATKDYYNGDLHLAWQQTMGDYSPTPLGSVVVADLHKREVVKIAVTGNDFYILNGGGGGSANFDSRQGPAAYRPTLLVNGKTSYTATRDTELSAALTGTLGLSLIMKDQRAMLVAFDTYSPKPGDTAVLVMTAEKEYGAHKLTVYPPAINPVFPTIVAPTGGKTVAEFRAADFHLSATVTAANNVVSGYWSGTNATAFSQAFQITTGNDYFLTVVIRLQQDWVDYGGKLPGLSNTGQATNTGGVPLTVNGVNCDNAGWGGRGANGCRWSARTGWSGRTGNQVGMQTYFYAQNPSSDWGIAQHWPQPAPVGEWFAYVERVRLNTPGQGDGELSYWMCTQQGCEPQVDSTGITWSSYDIPEARISEAWADVYCGGTNCGKAPWKRSTTDISRMTVTTGLPDLTVLFAEVQTMNAGK